MRINFLAPDPGNPLVGAINGFLTDLLIGGVIGTVFFVAGVLVARSFFRK